MSSIKIKYKLILIASIAVVAFGTSWLAFLILEAKEQITYHSDMSYMNKLICKTLDEYYDRNGRYPAKLTDMRQELLQNSYISEVPEKPKEIKMLDNFVYVTDGEYYEISSDVQHGDKLYTYRERAIRGKITFAEVYINRQLRSRYEYDDGCIYPFSGIERTYRDGKIVSQTVYKDGEIISETKY